MDVGHLIALTVGHTDRPTDVEARYMKIVMKSSNFKYIPEEFEGISPSPLLNKPVQSTLLPKIQPSPNVIKPGQLEVPKKDETPKL